MRTSEVRSSTGAHAIRLLVALSLLLGWALSKPSAAQEPPKIDTGPVGLPAQLHNRQPSFLVRAEVNHATRDYREGDALSIRVASEIDAFVHVFYQQADGRVFQIFPNQEQGDNFLPARRTVEIPAQDDDFRWVVSAPFGTESVKVVAAKRPIRGLADPSLREARFNAVTPGQLKGVELELGQEPPTEWAEFDVALHTYAKDAALTPPGTRRVGVFFGVSDYEFNAEYELASGGRKGLNLLGCNRDARLLAEVLREVGQLSDLRVYTNEKATRAQMEESITRWLPAVTRPGDTVIVFFSGHGLQIADDNGDEPDHEDEVLAPYDTVTLDIVAELHKQGTKLAPSLQARLSRFENVLRGELRRTGSAEKASNALVRETAVSDDMFGRWLQKLDGRQVIVILDNCHSGGFANDEKGGARVLEFDFLDREVTRLKDIGQREMALLSACATRQSSLTREEGDHGVMTYCLLDILRHTAGPVALQRAYDELGPRMKQYFEVTNRERVSKKKQPLPEHQPHLFSYATTPLFLKP